MPQAAHPNDQVSVDDGHGRRTTSGGAPPAGTGWLSMLKSAFWDFIADDAITQAAAVAFYTALSFAPLLMLATFVFSNLDRTAGTGAERQVVGEVHRLIGSEAGQVVEDVRQQQEKQQQQRAGFLTFAGIVGFFVLIWSASGVFVQLQAALNRIWDVEQKAGQSVWGWLRGRGFSITIVFAVLFLLLTSLIITAMINAIFGNGGTPEEPGRGTLAQIVNFVVSLGIYIVLFALIFKYLPDVKGARGVAGRGGDGGTVRARPVSHRAVPGQGPARKCIRRGCQRRGAAHLGLLLCVHPVLRRGTYAGVGQVFECAHRTRRARSAGVVVQGRTRQ